VFGVLGYRSARVRETDGLPRYIEGLELAEAAADGGGIRIGEMKTLPQTIGFISNPKK